MLVLSSSEFGANRSFNKRCPRQAVSLGDHAALDERARRHGRRRLAAETRAAFRENKIDDTVLPGLTAEDLKDLGVGFVGHRRKLLDAIAVLHAEASAPTPVSDAPPATDEAAK